MKKLFVFIFLFCILNPLSSFSAEKNAEYYYQQGLQAYENKDYKGAIASFDSSWVLSQNDYRIYLARANAYSGLKQFQKALNDYNKAIALNPKCSKAFEYRAIAKIGMEKYDNAVQDCNTAIKINPETQAAYFIRNQSNTKLEKEKEANVDEAIYKEKMSYMQPYLKTLEAAIKKNWKPAKIKQSFLITLMFNVNKNGEISDVKIIKSSEDELQDACAIKAVKISSPLAPLPSAYKGSSATFLFSFDAKLNEKNIFTQKVGCGNKNHLYPCWYFWGTLVLLQMLK